MALPTSLNTTYGPNPRTLLAADLNAIQDELKNLWDGDHGSRFRMLGPYRWFADTGASAALDAGNNHWVLDASAEEIYVRCPMVRNEQVIKVTFICNPLSATGLVMGFHADDFVTGTVNVLNSTVTSSVVGWQALELSPALTVGANDCPYLSAKFNAGSGGDFFGALLEYDQP